MIAIQRENLPMIRRLLAAGADVNAQHEAAIGDPALRYAVRTKNPNIVRLLMAAGANPNQPGWMQCTARDDAEDLKEPLRSEMLKALGLRPE